MFGKTTDDLAQTLMHMQDEARIACRHDTYKMVGAMAAMMANDRRFDFCNDKSALARDAMDCRRSGRELDLTRRLGSGATGPARYISKNV
jgi:hypothetical protein